LLQTVSEAADYELCLEAVKDNQNHRKAGSISAYDAFGDLPNEKVIQNYEGAVCKVGYGSNHKVGVKRDHLEYLHPHGQVGWVNSIAELVLIIPLPRQHHFLVGVHPRIGWLRCLPILIRVHHCVGTK